jgi:transposase-like protein
MHGCQKHKGKAMNRLPLEKRIQVVVGLLTEGSSLRSTSRICDVAINTVTKLLVVLAKHAKSATMKT